MFALASSLLCVFLAASGLLVLNWSVWSVTVKAPHLLGLFVFFLVMGGLIAIVYLPFSWFGSVLSYLFARYFWPGFSRMPGGLVGFGVGTALVVLVPFCVAIFSGEGKSGLFYSTVILISGCVAAGGMARVLFREQEQQPQAEPEESSGGLNDGVS